MNEQENQLIYSFPRNEEEEYQIHLSKFKGRYYTDFRLWFKAKGSSQGFIPKKKGISFEMEAVPEVLKGLNQLVSVWNQMNPSPSAGSRPAQAVSGRFKSVNPRQ